MCPKDEEELLNVWRLMRIIFIHQYVIKPQDDRRTSFIAKLMDYVIHAYRDSKYSLYCSKEHIERFKWIEEFPPLTNIHGKEEFDRILEEFDGKKYGGGVITTAYWLTYIFDIQERVEYIWSRFPIFYFMAFRLISGSDDYQRIEDDMILTEEVRDINLNMSLKHRFYQKLKLREALLATLTELAKNKESLPIYLSRKLCYSSSDKWVKQIANFLSHLSFSRKPKKRTWSALKDWICNPQMAYLLWQSSKGTLRDKMGKIVDKPISEWEENVEQLELPGDQWNKDFIQQFEKVVNKYKAKSSPRKGARKLYEKLNESRNNLMKEERLLRLYHLFLILRKYWKMK